MKLSADVVTELAQLRAQIAALQSKEKELSSDLKSAMDEKELSEYAPKDSPYKLLFNVYERASVSWKDEWKKLAKDKFGKKWKDKETDLSNESKIKVKSLNVEPNERYQQ